MIDETPTTPFWRERADWPLIHYLVALALVGTQVVPHIWGTAAFLAISYLLLYIHESNETLLALRFNYFTESRANGLLGDILIGAVAVTAFFLFDDLTRWDKLFRHFFSYWVRLVVFLVLAISSFFFERLNRAKRFEEVNKILRLGTCLYVAFYAILIALVFLVGAFYSGHHGKEHRDFVFIRTILWLIDAAFASLIVFAPLKNVFPCVVIVAFVTLLCSTLAHIFGK
jgi:hypothetical protein